MTNRKTIALITWIFVGKLMPLFFNTQSSFHIAFLPRSKHLLISWLQSPSAVILEPKKINSIFVSLFPPSICYEVMGLDAMILTFWMLSSKPVFHSPLSTSSRGSLVVLHFLNKGGVICISEVIDIVLSPLITDRCYYYCIVLYIFFIFIFFLLLYNIVLVLPYIKMHLPLVYMCFPSWTPLPPPSPYHSSGSSQCTWELLAKEIIQETLRLDEFSKFHHKA